jgi:GNAT superfamily N-acetyltransferase
MQRLEPIVPQVRLLNSDDSVAELTGLLHRAYRALAERGMRFMASHQDEEKTRERILGKECYLAFHGGLLAGTITLRSPKQAHGSPWLDREDVSSFGQFAVEPALQRHGIGSCLMEVVEARAREMGACELALDTAEPAEDLIGFYAARGYRFIEYVQWSVVDYRSVVMSKHVATPGGSI